MVKYKTGKRERELDFIFVSLSDTTRRKILKRVAKRPLSVSEIAKPYPISLPAISKHLNILERARLIRRTRQGREQIVRLNPKALKTAEEYMAWYKKFWETKLDSLKAYLEGGETDG